MHIIIFRLDYVYHTPRVILITNKLWPHLSPKKVFVEISSLVAYHMQSSLASTSKYAY